MKSLLNLKVLVLGLGKSGISTIKNLVALGAIVAAYDQKEIGFIEPDIIAELTKLKVELYCGEYPRQEDFIWELLVVSPGIPKETDLIQWAIAQGISVYGEVELAYQLKNEGLDLMAITGTNGKTTCTALLKHIMVCSGIEAEVAGNIGVPLIDQIRALQRGVLCVELSSFQLDTIVDFHAHICAITNITPDHLDRHKTMEAYAEAKKQILKNQTSADFAVLNYDDDLVRGMAEACQARFFYFSATEQLTQGIFVNENRIEIIDGNKTIYITDIDRLSLRGKHNLENCLCVAAMAYLYGAAAADIAKGLQTFTAVSHRMEEIGEVKGALFINDSKATNPESAMKAIESFTEEIILIAGGRNKGSSFDEFAECIKENVKELILLGETKAEISAAVMNQGFKNIYEVEDLEQAVNLAVNLAKPGQVVLLSPACASWDMFSNYEQRGDRFRELVLLHQVDC